MTKTSKFKIRQDHQTTLWRKGLTFTEDLPWERVPPPPVQNAQGCAVTMDSPHRTNPSVGYCSAEITLCYQFAIVTKCSSSKPCVLDLLEPAQAIRRWNLLRQELKDNTDKKPVVYRHQM